jgi:hypothetical protein
VSRLSRQYGIFNISQPNRPPLSYGDSSTLFCFFTYSIRDDRRKYPRTGLCSVAKRSHCRTDELHVVPPAGGCVWHAQRMKYASLWLRCLSRILHLCSGYRKWLWTRLGDATWFSDVTSWRHIDGARRACICCDHSRWWRTGRPILSVVTSERPIL